MIKYTTDEKLETNGSHVSDALWDTFYGIMGQVLQECLPSESKVSSF